MTDSRETRVTAVQKPDIWDTGTAAFMISALLLAGGLYYACGPALLLFSLTLAMGLYQKVKYVQDHEPILQRNSIKALAQDRSAQPYR